MFSARSCLFVCASSRFSLASLATLACRYAGDDVYGRQPAVTLDQHAHGTPPHSPSPHEQLRLYPQPGLAHSLLRNHSPATGARAADCGHAGRQASVSTPPSARDCCMKRQTDH